jgi:hypothetical protein
MIIVIHDQQRVFKLLIDGLVITSLNGERLTTIIPKLVDFIYSEYGAKSFSVLLPSSHLYDSAGLETNATLPQFLTKIIFKDLNFAVLINLLMLYTQL